MYQLCLGDESLASVIDRIVDRACAADAGLDRSECLHLVELVFRSRVRQTNGCGAHPECQPVAALFTDASPPTGGETCEWADLDPEGLPAMFAAAAADLSDVPRSRRVALELRLAAVMRDVLRETIHRNPRCGRADICHGKPIDPFRGRPRR